MSNACDLNTSGSVPEISPADLSKKLDQLLVIDVRRPDEFSGELGHIKGAKLMTLETELSACLDQLPKDKSYVFCCRSGKRSFVATQMAQERGYRAVYNMTGGMIAWNSAGLPVDR